MGLMQRTTRSAPCIFCGDVGYDMRITYQTEEGGQETIHWCHKTKAAKHDIISSQGIDYICISAGKVIDIGEFDLFKEYVTKEDWLRKNKSTTGSIYNKKKLHNSYDTIKPVENEAEVLPNEKLHEIYTCFLNMLVLEDKHIQLLRSEWENPIHPELMDVLSKTYPIKSLPPIDRARYYNKEGLKNPKRKEITKALIQKFGSLEGVPGFYELDTPYYKDKPKEERWTFVGSEGIIFPCYDKDGYIYRIRYRDDYPDIIIKEGKHLPFQNMYGSFSHSYDKEGQHTWTFHPKNGKPMVVWNKEQKLINLSTNNMPLIKGKVSGKYKNFSSYSIKDEDNILKNRYLHGCRSGSPYSLYSTNNQSFTVVIGTEGEKKGMVTNYFKKFPVVSLPGVSCYSSIFNKDKSNQSLIDSLKQKGMKYFILCYDADKHTNEDVLKAEKRFIEELKKNNVIPLTGEWKNKFDKGIDDILLLGLDITIMPAK